MVRLQAGMGSYNVAKTICGVFNGLRKGSSIIAGGYLRDLDLGRKPKDVDLIIEYEGEEDLALAEKFGKAFGYTSTVKGKGYIDREVKCVLAFEKDGEVKIDVIFLTVPVMERLAIFPCNICKIWTDQTGLVEATPEYSKGILNKEIIYNRGTAREKYIDKMHEYFPDWSHDMQSWEAKEHHNERKKARAVLNAQWHDIGKEVMGAVELVREVDIVEVENFVGPDFDGMKAKWVILDDEELKED